MRLLVLIGGLISSLSTAAEVDKLHIEMSSFYTKHDMSIPEYSVFKTHVNDRDKKETWAGQISLKLDLTLTDTVLGQTYWNNAVTGRTTTRQFRYVGYEFEVGQRLTDGLDVFYHHHSEHVLEVYRQGYPLADSFGVRFKFID